MSARRTTRQVLPRKEFAPHPHPLPVADGSKGPSSAERDALLQRKYRDLICKHLDQSLARLFAEITGLRFRVSWAPRPVHEWGAENLPSGCPVCCRLITGGKCSAAKCRTCWPRHLRIALESRRGHGFTCECGLRAYWSPIRIRGKTLAIACLQSLDAFAANCPGRNGSPRAARRLRFEHATARQRLLERRVKTMGQLEFARVTRFLRHIVEHAQTATLADLRKDELIKAQRTLRVLENLQARFRRDLNAVWPSLRKTSPGPQAKSRPEQIVHRLLERIESDYAASITLQSYAREFDMNAAYLSALFSRLVGLPFKTYLTELRLEKAKALLGDPAKNASQVAYAVGYASENRFRSVFKKATGASPKLWRETLQMNPSPPTA
jgi:AraC-like DNA-binding protein